MLNSFTVDPLLPNFGFFNICPKILRDLQCLLLNFERNSCDVTSRPPRQKLAGKIVNGCLSQRNA